MESRDMFLPWRRTWGGGRK